MLISPGWDCKHPLYRYKMGRMGNVLYYYYIKKVIQTAKDYSSLFATVSVHVKNAWCYKLDLQLQCYNTNMSILRSYSSSQEKQTSNCGVTTIPRPQH